MKLVIADDHNGLWAAARRVFNATHQRCRIHWMSNAPAHVPAKQRTAVAAMQRTIVAQETEVEAEQQWGIVADALREKQRKLNAVMDASRDDVLRAGSPYLSELWRVVQTRRHLDGRHGAPASAMFRRSARSTGMAGWSVSTRTGGRCGSSSCGFAAIRSCSSTGCRPGRGSTG